jgi:hypothetical protein
VTIRSRFIRFKVVVWTSCSGIPSEQKAELALAKAYIELISRRGWTRRLKQELWDVLRTRETHAKRWKGVLHFQDSVYVHFEVHDKWPWKRKVVIYRLVPWTLPV